MSGLSAAFAEPVAEAQACFRAVLDAMARPGRIHRTGGLIPPAPLGAAAAAVLLTLVDHETPIWIDPAAEAAAAWIRFHCGAPRTAMTDAAFGIALSLPELDPFPAGTHEAPEISATLVVQVAGLGSGPVWRLSGPGIPGSAALAIDGLPKQFAGFWERNHRRFPRGVDLILCADDRLAALPRSVRVEEG